MPPRGGKPGGLKFFSAELQEERWARGVDRTHVDLVAPEGSFPDGLRFLATIHQHGRMPYTAIIDRDGHVLRELGDHATFYGTSVSRDGRYVIGFREIGSPVGDDIVGAPLYLSDANAKWVIPVEGGFHGLWPRFSPKDFLLAFANPATGHVHVGTLDVYTR
jgi:hypothetical protein